MLLTNYCKNLIILWIRARSLSPFPRWSKEESEEHRMGGRIMSMYRKVFFCLIVFSLAACSSNRGMWDMYRMQRYRDSNMDFGAVKTVAVMPFVNLSRDQLAGDRVRDVFANALLSTGAVYVLPPGEVARGVTKAEISNPLTPSPEEVIKLGKAIKAEAIVTGTLKEYGEVRSSTTSANIVSMSLQMIETETGKVVWTASTTRGGITFWDRLLGGGGQPMEKVTMKAVDDLVKKLRSSGGHIQMSVGYGIEAARV